MNTKTIVISVPPTSVWITPMRSGSSPVSCAKSCRASANATHAASNKEKEEAANALPRIPHVIRFRLGLEMGLAAYSPPHHQPPNAKIQNAQKKARSSPAVISIVIIGYLLDPV